MRLSDLAPAQVRARCHGGGLRFNESLNLLGNHLRRLNFCLCSSAHKMAEAH